MHDLFVVANFRVYACSYSFKEEIQTRLHFLSFVFSTIGSPDNFREWQFRFLYFSSNYICL